MILAVTSCSVQSAKCFTDTNVVLVYYVQLRTCNFHRPMAVLKPPLTLLGTPPAAIMMDNNERIHTQHRPISQNTRISFVTYKLKTIFAKADDLY